MCTITATEFKTNFGKYIKLGQKESLRITSHGKVIMETFPEHIAAMFKFYELKAKCPSNIPFDAWKDREE